MPIENIQTQPKIATPVQKTQKQPDKNQEAEKKKSSDFPDFSPIKQPDNSPKNFITTPEIIKHNNITEGYKKRILTENNEVSEEVNRNNCNPVSNNQNHFSNIDVNNYVQNNNRPHTNNQRLINDYYNNVAKLLKNNQLKENNTDNNKHNSNINPNNSTMINVSQISSIKNQNHSKSNNNDEAPAEDTVKSIVIEQKILNDKITNNRDTVACKNVSDKYSLVPYKNNESNNRIQNDSNKGNDNNPNLTVEEGGQNIELDENNNMVAFHDVTNPAKGGENKDNMNVEERNMEKECRNDENNNEEIAVGHINKEMSFVDSLANNSNPAIENNAIHENYVAENHNPYQNGKKLNEPERHTTIMNHTENPSNNHTSKTLHNHTHNLSDKHDETNFNSPNNDTSAIECTSSVKGAKKRKQRLYINFDFKKSKDIAENNKEFLDHNNYICKTEKLDDSNEEIMKNTPSKDLNNQSVTNELGSEALTARTDTLNENRNTDVLNTPVFSSKSFTSEPHPFYSNSICANTFYTPYNNDHPHESSVNSDNIANQNKNDAKNISPGNNIYNYHIINIKPEISSGNNSYNEDQHSRNSVHSNSSHKKNSLRVVKIKQSLSSLEFEVVQKDSGVIDIDGEDIVENNVEINNGVDPTQSSETNKHINLSKDFNSVDNENHREKNEGNMQNKNEKIQNSKNDADVNTLGGNNENVLDNEKAHQIYMGPTQTVMSRNDYIPNQELDKDHNNFLSEEITENEIQKENLSKDDFLNSDENEEKSVNNTKDSLVNNENIKGNVDELKQIEMNIKHNGNLKTRQKSPDKFNTKDLNKSITVEANEGNKCFGENQSIGQLKTFPLMNACENIDIFASAPKTTEIVSNEDVDDLQNIRPDHDVDGITTNEEEIKGSKINLRNESINEDTNSCKGIDEPQNKITETDQTSEAQNQEDDNSASAAIISTESQKNQSLEDFEVEPYKEKNFKNKKTKNNKKEKTDKNCVGKKSIRKKENVDDQPTEKIKTIKSNAKKKTKSKTRVPKKNKQMKNENLIITSNVKSEINYSGHERTKSLQGESEESSCDKELCGENIHVDVNNNNIEKNIIKEPEKVKGRIQIKIKKEDNSYRIEENKENLKTENENTVVNLKIEKDSNVVNLKMINKSKKYGGETDYQDEPQDLTVNKKRIRHFNECSFDKLILDETNAKKPRVSFD